MKSNIKKNCYQKNYTAIIFSIRRLHYVFLLVIKKMSVYIHSALCALYSEFICKDLKLR